jgi:hypothetical protein
VLSDKVFEPSEVLVKIKFYLASMFCSNVLHTNNLHPPPPRGPTMPRGVHCTVWEPLVYSIIRPHSSETPASPAGICPVYVFLPNCL